MKQMKLQMQPGEVFYGLCAHHGRQMPLDEHSRYAYDFRSACTTNQEASLLLSNQGRFVWSASPWGVDCANGVLTLECAGEIVCAEGYGDLRGAYLAANARFFPSNGECPPLEFFVKPQYNTWIELQYDQTQAGVLRYAHDILTAGLPAGILMVDDNWNRDYGNWTFKPDAFPDPKGMTEQLHRMGFQVMLWLCPFVSPDSRVFRQLEREGVLVRGADGQTAIRKWWNGYSAVLDMSHPKAVEWLDAQCRALMEQFGIDGFKLDAGDVYFYRDDDRTYGGVSAYEQCALWGKFGARFRYNEYRACVGCAGLPLVQRLCDKPHTWVDGVDTLLPNTLAQGIIGYAYSCPDMIGGGEAGSFNEHKDRLDQELFVRYAQCAALLPMMQFSAAPWRVLDEAHAALCRAAAELHLKMAPAIEQAVRQAAQTGEPMVRYMEYAYPHQGLEHCTDQFMLGDALLAAPVWTQGAVTRCVRLPKGKWKYNDGTVYEGGCTVEVQVGLETVPCFMAQ